MCEVVSDKIVANNWFNTIPFCMVEFSDNEQYGFEGALGFGRMASWT